jgi:hypothetical protein
MSDLTLDATIAAFGVRTGIFDLMNTAWAWPIAESLHFMGLALLLGTIGIVDMRLLGLARALPLQALHPLTRWGIAGFAINALTGFAFFVSAPDQYLYNPVFQLKVGCMLLAAANLVAFYRIAWPRVQDGSQTPLAARICGGISLGCWIGVICFGRLITFYRPPEHWCFWCA